MTRRPAHAPPANLPRATPTSVTLRLLAWCWALAALVVALPAAPLLLTPPVLERANDTPTAHAHVELAHAAAEPEEHDEHARHGHCLTCVLGSAEGPALSTVTTPAASDTLPAAPDHPLASAEANRGHEARAPPVA